MSWPGLPIGGSLVRGPWLAGLVLLAFACQTAPEAPAPDASQRPDSPSARAFFADPPFAHASLSPDGTRLAGITSRDGTRVLIEKPLRGGEIRYLEKFDDPLATVAEVGWSGDGVVVVILAGADGAGAPTLAVSAYDLRRWRPLRIASAWPLPAPAPGDPPVVAHWLPDDPEQLLIQVRDARDGTARLRRVQVRSGLGPDVSPELPGAERWYVDGEGRARAASVTDPESLTPTLSARADGEGDFVPLRDVDFAREATLAFAGFGAGPDTIYVHAETRNGRRGLYRYDLRQGQRAEEILAHETLDVGPLLPGPDGARPWAATLETDPPSLHFLDPEAEREQASIDATFPGLRNRIFAGDRRGALALVEVSGPAKPPEVYVYDRERRQLDFLYAAWPGLEGAALAPMRAVSFAARDGAVVPAYLTLPRGVAPQALPVIVLPHDGPTQRDTLSWDARVQFLASRGFAVFQPNTRGSAGYGRDFERRGHGAWGGVMQDDLVDGVAWLVAEGIADPDRVGIFGAGYGGYAALMGAVTAPGVFRAVASWGGVSDLVDLVDHPEHHTTTDPNAPIVWANPRERARLGAWSPRQRASEIGVPVLLGHGSADRTVDASQSRAMARALELAGGEVSLRIYRGEGHSFAAAQNRIDFHRALAEFFEAHLAPALPSEGGGA